MAVAVALVATTKYFAISAARIDRAWDELWFDIKIIGVGDQQPSVGMIF
jgi:hypothetical protein